MIDLKKLTPVLEGYKRYFPGHWDGEKYKWEAVKHFQDHWDIDAENFGEMFRKATEKTYNLLASGYAYPRTTIINFAQADDEAARSMFRNLFDESQDLAARIDAFQTASEELRSKYDDGTWRSHYQNTNAISTYLWLRYPDKYYIYKYELFRAAAKELSSDYMPRRNGSAENVIGGYRMYDEISEAIKADPDIRDMLHDALTPSCHPDSEMKTAAIDVGFYLARFYLKEQSAKHKEELLLPGKYSSGSGAQNASLYTDSAPSIWKISEGTESTGISATNKKIFLERQVVVVDSATGAKATSKVSQGQLFMESVKKGDYFYLCYGNSIRLLGQFTGDRPYENPEMKNGWYERSYRVIAESVDTSSYTGKKKWWTPNDNSTCIRVSESEYPQFQELILQPYFAMTINELFDETLPLQKQKYTREDFLSQVYMTGERYDVLAALLRSKMNVILQGAPGVGKTFAAKKLAYSMMGEIDPSRIQMIQFHQNYSYEDFIMGYRPDGAEFKLTEGIFFRFCQKAANDPEKEYFFIIDEINRGNMSRIFGELLMLIEKDYRGTQAVLAYSSMPFSVPENLYLIGMMNTADRSLAMIDYALRRRFSFFEMEPAFHSDGFTDYQKSLGSETFDALIHQIGLLNKKISEDPSLGRGFQIGHSYFCGREEAGCTDEWMRSVVEFDILPMLSEYWFDEPEKLHEWERNLRGVFDD